jgi:hypothetical protein
MPEGPGATARAHEHERLELGKLRSRLRSRTLDLRITRTPLRSPVRSTRPHPSLDKDLAAATPGRKPPPIIDYTHGPGHQRQRQDVEGRSHPGDRVCAARPGQAGFPAATLLAPILAGLPRRGSFTTDASPTGGKINVHDWGTRHAADIAAITSADVVAEKEWERLFKEPGTPFSTALTTPSPYFHVNTQNRRQPPNWLRGGAGDHALGHGFSSMLARDVSEESKLSRA